MLWPTAFCVQTGMIKWYKKVLDQPGRQKAVEILAALMI